jgi:hypothetical protein
LAPWRKTGLGFWTWTRLRLNVTRYLHSYTTHRETIHPVLSFTAIKNGMFLGKKNVCFEIPKLCSAHLVLHSLLSSKQHECYSVVPGILFYVHMHICHDKHASFVVLRPTIPDIMIIVYTLITDCFELICSITWSDFIFVLGEECMYTSDPPTHRPNWSVESYCKSNLISHKSNIINWSQILKNPFNVPTLQKLINKMEKN